MLALKIILLVVIAYFLGNINFARIISKLHKNKDITKLGSGNPGTMNMLRNFGFFPAVATLFLEALKGAIPALVGFFLLKGDGLAFVGLYAGGLAAMLGHCFPLIYKFKGGKGAATMVGVFIVANPLWTLIAFVIGLILVFITDKGALASLEFALTLSIVEIVNHSSNVYVICLVVALFILLYFKHRTNIVRLLTGKENSANFKSSFKKKKTEVIIEKESEEKGEIIEVIPPKENDESKN